MGYSVQLILDSVNAVGVRLCTWELCFPRMVHAELMTHRVFSRNSASSRAIPTERLLGMIEEDPVEPKWWGKNQSGMQAREELTGLSLDRVRERWLRGRDEAVALSRDLQKLGLHKQIANRPIEAWMFITVVMSTTLHENWYDQRDHGDAQPEIAWVASTMHEISRSRVPTFLPTGAWHRPYMRDGAALSTSYTPRTLNLISAGRCAAVSYLNHGEGVDPEKDLSRAEKLLGAHPSHRSPFEHVAQARGDMTPVGNFHGWTQFRKLIPQEAGPAELIIPPRAGNLSPEERAGVLCACRVKMSKVAQGPNFRLMYDSCAECCGTGRLPVVT